MSHLFKINVCHSTSFFSVICFRFAMFTLPKRCWIDHTPTFTEIVSNDILYAVLYSEVSPYFKNCKMKSKTLVF